MLIAMRHGPTKLNDPSQERFRGWLDVPVTPEGLSIVRKVAQKVRGLQIADLHASDLQRTMKTAEIVGHALDKPVQADSSLRPWDLGSMAGKLVSQVKPELLRLMNHPEESAPDGESLQTFLDRFIPHVEKWILDNQIHFIVTHFRNIKALEAFASTGGKSVDPTVMQKEASVLPAGIIVLDRHYLPYTFNP